MIETPIEVLRHLKVRRSDGVEVRITTFEDHVEYARQQIAKRAEFDPKAAMWDNNEPMIARVDQGRWVIDCVCKAGNVVHPDWGGQGVCSNCGAKHHQVIFPDAAMRQQIELILEQRPGEQHKFWFPYETISQINQENNDHMSVVRDLVNDKIPPRK